MRQVNNLFPCFDFIGNALVMPTAFGQFSLAESLWHPITSHYIKFAWYFTTILTVVQVLCCPEVTFLLLCKMEENKSPTACIWDSYSPCFALNLESAAEPGTI